MVNSLIAMIALTQLHQAKDVHDQLGRLSASRGAFDKHIVRPKNPRLRILEELGTNNLGNPFREWYYPSGSASSRIWIVFRYASPGALVYQSKHGKFTETDWVLDLDTSKNEPKPSGTLSRILWILGYRVKGPVTRAQEKVLNAVRGYAAFAEGRGPNQGDIRTWYVFSDGRLAPNYYDCMPIPKQLGGGAYEVDERLVTISPPITPEEATEMGIPRAALWQGPGKFVVETRKLSWERRPELPSGIPVRSARGKEMPSRLRPFQPVPQVPMLGDRRADPSIECQLPPGALPILGFGWLADVSAGGA